MKCSDRRMGRRSGPIHSVACGLAGPRPKAGRSTPAYAVAERSASNRFANLLLAERAAPA